MTSVGQLVPQMTPTSPNMTIKLNGPHIEGTTCSIEDNYDPIVAAISAVYVALGIVYTIFGKNKKKYV